MSNIIQQADIILDNSDDIPDSDGLANPRLINEVGISVPLKSWVNCKKYIINTNNIGYYLDASYTKIDNIPGLKTTLFPHQKTIVRAMLDLENNRTFDLYDITDTFGCKTTAGVLSEAVGSGKTIDILSVILMQKIPKVFPDISELKMCVENYNYSYKKKSYYECSIRKKFHNILKTTIIFAGVSVINQWIESIKTFTSLKYFAVFDVRDLQKLINKMADKSINSYDVVIVKNGKVTRSVKFPNYVKIEDKNLDKTTLYIYNIVGNMRNFCWARVVIDDFDTIKLPHNAGIVNGLFTWYISSTKKHMNVKHNQGKFKTTSDMLMYNNYNCGNIMNNKLLFNNLNICNSPEFVKNTNNINSPVFYAYKFNNPNDQYIGFLSLMGDGEANEVMEMLNGDAIETAAERIGIKTNSVADIFQIMLGKQFDKYKKSINVLEFITEVEPMQGLRTPMSENPDDEDTYKKTDLFIRREILYNYPNLKGLLDGTKEEYTEVRQKSSIAIDRVKNNIKTGECAICANDLDDEEEDTMILKCCGNIVCGMCCFGTIFPKKSSRGQCSNCRSQLSLTGLIYLNSEFDLNKIVNDDFVEENDEEPEPEEKKEIQKPRTKMTAIVDIIRGITPVEQILVDVNINNLMKGTHELPEASYNKVLIFANFDETIKKIKETLCEEKIDFWQLGGSHSEIDKTVSLFTKCTHTCVLIVNSMKHCSGLNLQTATDLIFAHKIIDPNVETQVIGRGQRLGRTTTLKVHFMMYENEYNYMLRYNTIREL
jgi:SNF2 family DNA or RNA helicase